MGLLAIPTRKVLTTPIAVVSYEELRDHLYAITSESGPTAVEFTNTHVTTLRALDQQFCSITDDIDCFIPDGQPLIWVLQIQGVRINERIYGPTFMRRFLSECPHVHTHFLLGGTATCGEALRKSISQNYPQVQITGSKHGLAVTNGLFGGTIEQNQHIIEEINRLKPDFIWVALGTPTQQRWISENKNKILRGVILGVGFAFDVLAGTKPDAPAFMQKLGLTWLFRLCSEPRRLAKRYLIFNTLFLWFLLHQMVQAGLFRLMSPRTSSRNTKK